MQQLFRILYNCENGLGILTEDLAARYGSGLSFSHSATERPFLFSNFVTSLDGMIAYGSQQQSEGRLISRKSHADQWLMGLLRGIADAVIVGAGNLHAESAHLWTASALKAADSELLQTWRYERGKASAPLQCIVSGSGRVSPDCRVFKEDIPLVILTTSEGQRNLPVEVSQKACIVSDSEEGGIDWSVALKTLKNDYGIGYALCEGGALLFGSLMRAGMIDECFQTLSPLMIGQQSFTTGRRGLIEGAAFQPKEAPRFRLISARIGIDEKDLLFLRYRRGLSGRTDG